MTSSLLGPHGPVRHVMTPDSGYSSAKFDGKQVQQEQVMDELDRRGFLPENLIESETKWFYNDLNIDDSYFATESIDGIVSHILSLYAAKISAYSSEDKRLVVRLAREASDHAVYIDTSKPGDSNLDGPKYEERIDERYLSPSSSDEAFRLETFRSPGALADTNDQLRCFFVYKCNFDAKVDLFETDLKKISDKSFYEKATANTKMIYQSIINQAVKRSGPVIELYEVDGGAHERRVIIGYRQGTAPGYFAALSDLYHFYGLTSTRKYVEQFANGITVVSLYLVPAPQPRAKNLQEIKALPHFPPIENSIHQVIKEASLLYCVPQNQFQKQFALGQLSLQESIYAHCVSIFVSHFLNRLGPVYNDLRGLLDSNNQAHQEVLEGIKRRLRSETFTREYVHEIIESQLVLVKQLYLQFADVHYVQSHGEGEGFLPTLSYQRLQTANILTAPQLKALISKSSHNEHERLVFEGFMTFNDHILKTNFYTPTKVALSFRFKPDFLPESEYPQPLFGMFLVVGQEFRGFHLRFRDIARGGIRIVKSRNKEAYSINVRSIFDENYNLANTQQRKNKDIPEGGSKGVILLDMAHQDKEAQAFHKYIDSILDLLLPGSTPGIKDKIVDLYKKEEILFMGPDENTAGLVDWATQHAKERGASWWKSFFTGKSPSLGGIPHDEYGMTSLSVREYVKGIYRKLSIDQSNVTKMQTGGPDGDLGSNEILLSNEKYVSIVDGSGVLHDPNGLNKNELLRLAKERKVISHYDSALLSKDGYKVLVDDVDLILPSGEVVADGTNFRNTFHLNPATNKLTQIFVPCGGRPEAININNVNKLLNKDGSSIIPYYVEGANLFLTQTAKLKLESAGAIVFKDASTNKGGVTSSSLEVLASLAFDDKGFFTNMCVSKSGEVPEFYQAYVRSVQRIIKNNARLEFEALWREHKATGKPYAVLSDELSVAINDLSEDLSKSNLWSDVEFRNEILKQALPDELTEKLGLEAITQRVPDSYLRAIFGSFLAGRFVYEKGPNPGQFAFFEYMVHLRNGGSIVNME